MLFCGHAKPCELEEIINTQSQEVGVIEANLFQPPVSLTVQEMESCDWGEEYKKCPCFRQIWEEVHGAEPKWPEKYHLSGGRLLFEGRLCIPTSLQHAWIRL